MLDHRHDRPVLFVAVVLHPGADSPRLTRIFERGLPDQEPLSLLRCRVVRVWQLSVEALLAGGEGTLPLAPVSDVSEARLPDVIRRMKERLCRERRRRRVRDLWATTYGLLGYRYTEAVAKLIIQEVLGMKESTTYQAIVREGGIAKARLILFRLGRKLFGPVDDAAEAALNAIEDEAKSDGLADRILDVGSWQELLQPPLRRQRRSETKRKKT